MPNDTTSANSSMEASRADPHRPAYHFTAPANWLNDPNGLIQWRGRYHLFYQHNPERPWWGLMHWGHAVSDDLVHWEHLPIALTPTPGGPDQDGCFSGCAVVHNGVPTFIYTGVKGKAQLPCLATSDDDDLITWTKYSGNPVIAAPPDDVDVVFFRDHSVWQEGGAWYQVVGSGIADQGGTALLYRSEDLVQWTYLHPLLVGDKERREPFWTGDGWECPDFFALGDRHTLIISVWNGGTHFPAYFVGRYTDQRLTLETEGVLDAGGHFYAPQSFTDDGGRRIMFGWLREARSQDQQGEAGWSGAMSLPRQLSLGPDGDLAVIPAPEIEVLRGSPREVGEQHVSPGSPVRLDGIEGDCLELDVTFDGGDATSFGLNVRCSPDGEEQTSISYDPARGLLTVDGTRSSRNPGARGDVRSAQLTRTDEPLRLRVFLDRSVLEIFANDRVCITERLYPERADSVGIELFAVGGSATLRHITAWELAAVT